MLADRIRISQGKKTTGKIYGVVIDENNSNPETSVTYTDDAVGFTPMLGGIGLVDLGSWTDTYPLNQIKPCLHKDGEVNYYLDSNDFAKKEDGSPSDITSGDDGNVMIEFPKLWWKIEKIDNLVYVKFADYPTDGFICPAHTIGKTEKEKIYIGAYLSSLKTTNTMVSVSGQLPNNLLSQTNIRTHHQANGPGYQVMTYYCALMLQVLYIVWFKNRNSQSAFAHGRSSLQVQITGLSNTYGMFYGAPNASARAKFAGIEDIYGNIPCFIDGITYGALGGLNKIRISNQDIFNNNGDGYSEFDGPSSILNGYVKTALGDSRRGFNIESVYSGDSGSNLVYYCDISLYTTSIRGIRFGSSDINVGASSGIFSLCGNVTGTNSGHGSRLCYLGTED